ncbi:MAG TPA: DUF1592 domain-containing protein [Pirellulales bacterium]|jgi:hypothetical protein|nr:DUF1592 domain-containing protein [Pirellulales bacterium]
MQRSILVIVMLCAASVPTDAVAAPIEREGFGTVVRPFFAAHCTKCHGEQKHEGDLRLDTLTVDFDSPKAMAPWEEIMNRINSGDMPPEDEPRPKPDDVSRVADWIVARLREADAAQHAADGDRVAFRRLSRGEYANTIRDLLGVTFDVDDPTGLPEDPDWQGFERIGSVLTLSPAHVEKYLAAAEMVLDEALPLGKQPERKVTRWTPFDLRSWKKFEPEYRTRGIADKVRIDLVPNNGALDTRTLYIKTTGDYMLRVKVSGLRPGDGRAPRLRLYSGDLSRTLLEQDVVTPEHEPIVIEKLVHLPAGEHPIRIVNAVPGPNPEGRRSRASGTPNAFTDLRTRVPWQIKFTDDDGKPIVPFLLVDYIEWDGPIVESWPRAAHQRIFFEGEHGTNDAAYAREIVARFAQRAFRRPVEKAELERLVQLYEQAQSLGNTFEQSVRTTLVAVLCSKSVLYLEEGNAAAPSATLTDWELASRLSYFLWSTMPDDRLFELARAGKLHEPATLRGEVRRMLADPKAAAFAEAFPRQWLQLRRVGMFTPDKVLYPEYDDYLENSMIAETVGFFGEVLGTNASLREFLESDWTLLNERLADHYGLDKASLGIHDDTFRRVTLSAGDHRGGVLTQASILSLTSDGTRQRPVHRGVWVLESLLNRPPPPPPANVPALGTPAAGTPKTTVRAKLEAHRADAQCAACHRKIDPLGIAFDNYDAIGRWRTIETVRDGTGSDPTLDPSGSLPDGRHFADAAELKRLLVDDIDSFAAAFTEKLATYALRRGMTFTDRAEIQRIAREAKPNDYHLATLIERLATSDLFQRR